MTHLREAAVEYECAEITCIFLHNKKTDKKTNLLAIFELVPTEQQVSLMIGDKSTYYMKREAVDQIHTLYITRLVNIPIDETISKYETIKNGLKLQYDNLNVDIEFPFLLEEEPPNYFNLLIGSKEEKTVGRILPNRNTCLRVWSKLNLDKQWMQSHDKKVWEKLSKISRDSLGYDLSLIPEHIGNVYLCAANPLLRKWNSSFLDREKDLLISFNERAGKTIVGGKIVIEEERSKNIGFTVTRTISEKEERIALPYQTDALNTKIYSPSGELIEHLYGTRANIQFNMNIQEAIVKLKVETENGLEVYSVPKISSVGSTTVGKYDLTTAHYLRTALNRRKFEELESKKEFIFFLKDDSSRERARNVVRELLNKARRRCIILDPYFGPADLVFALTISNISIPIRIISSAVMLNGNVDAFKSLKKSRLQKIGNFFSEFFQKTQKATTNGEQLHENILNYRITYPQQKIECKVLKGRKSPLHDRYIVIDDVVYLLGSSLNEFGSRVTTIIKVPAPIKMIDQAEEWWADEDCPYLEDFIIKKEN